MARVITAHRIDQMLQRASQGDKDVSVDEDLSTLTEALSRKRLKTLDLSGLEATDLDVSALQGFSTLRKLNLSANSLQHLPEGVFGKRSNHNKDQDQNCEAYAPLISWLNLAKNGLLWKGLKPIAPLAHLVTLNLSDNRVTKFPKILSRRLVKLKALVLSRNKLKSFELVHDMKNLNSLVLSHNAISTMTEETLRHMPRLAKLSISNNHFDAIPHVNVCPLLAELRIVHNMIVDIRVDLTGMEKLKLLDLGHNRLRSLMDVAPLKPLNGLMNLNLAGNPAILQDGEPIPFASVAMQVTDILKNGSLRILNSKPLAKFGIISSPAKGVNERFERAQWKRKKNLVSTKLPQPDASKPRNKPCPCGSRKKFKLCCELKHKPKQTESAPPSAITESIIKPRFREASTEAKGIDTGSTSHDKPSKRGAGTKKDDAAKPVASTSSKSVASKAGSSSKPDDVAEPGSAKTSQKQKKKKKKKKKSTKQPKEADVEGQDSVKLKRKRATRAMEKETVEEDTQSKVLRVTSFSTDKTKKSASTDESLASAVRRASEPSFEAW